jgi:hypothetical protein
MLLFFIPIVLVLALVAYAIFDTTTFRNGTLVVNAETSNRYYSVRYLNVSVSVSGKPGITPLTLSLSQGTYTVSFASQQWFRSPQSRTVVLGAGQTSYVVGVYDPNPVLIAINQGAFNASKVAVMHGFTPLILINPTPDYQVVSSSFTGRIFIAPFQNYTYIFQTRGTFAFSLVGTHSPELTVTSE